MTIEEPEKLKDEDDKCIGNSNNIINKGNWWENLSHDYKFTSYKTISLKDSSERNKELRVFSSVPIPADSGIFLFSFIIYLKNIL